MCVSPSKTTTTSSIAPSPTTTTTTNITAAAAASPSPSPSYSSSSSSQPHHLNRQAQIPRSAHQPLSSTPSSSTQACAACKYQRRKCQPNCILAPYFPAEQQQTFLNAHRLFGVRNILSTLKNINPTHHRDAMRSIIYHSNVRAQDPVLGCVGVILELQRLIAHHSRELEFVLQQLHTYRVHVDAQTQALNMSNMLFSDHANDNVNLVADSDAPHVPGNLCYDVSDENNVGPNPTWIDQQLEQERERYYAAASFPNNYLGNEELAGNGNGNGNDNAALGFIGHKDEDVQQSMVAPPAAYDGDLFDGREQALLIASHEQQKLTSAHPFYSKSSLRQQVEQREDPNTSELDLKDAASLFSLTHYNPSSSAV